MIRRLASLHWLQPGAVRQLRRYYQDAMTSCRSSRRPPLPLFGGTAVSLVAFAPQRTSAPLKPGVGNPVSPAGMLPRKRQELPSSWGTSSVRLHMFHSDSGGTAHTRPLQCSSVAPVISKAKAPTTGLSKLNSMAFGLAVYASQDGLPRHHAKLASGRWSGAAGRAFHPQGPYERFQSCILTSHPPFPSFAWHKEIDRRTETDATWPQLTTGGLDSAGRLEKRCFDGAKLSQSGTCAERAVQKPNLDVLRHPQKLSIKRMGI
jgi:hypothetical protein